MKALAVACCLFAWVLPRGFANNSINPEAPGVAKKQAQAWWQARQLRGSLASLVSDLSSGLHSSDHLVDQLRTKDADSLEGALLTGLDKSNDLGTMRGYLSHLSRLNSPTVTASMLKLMTQGRTLQIRAGVAEELWKQQQQKPVVLPAMIKEWEAKRLMASSEPRGSLGELITFLVYSGKAEAVVALARDADQLHVEQKVWLMTELADSLRDPKDPKLSNLSISLMKPQSLEPAAKDAAEGLMVHLLDDTNVLAGRSGWYGDFEYTDGRACDFALWVLHRMNAARYAFSKVAGREQRDQERLNAMNAWRKEHQMPLLALASLTPPKVAAADALKITSVKMYPAPAVAPSGFAHDFMALLGQALSEETMAGLLRSYVSDEHSGIAGLTIEAVRDDNLTGVRLIANLELGGAPKPSEWSVNARVASGKKDLLSMATGTNRKDAIRKGRWELLLKGVNRGLDLPPTAPFVISVTLEPGIMRAHTVSDK